jgi:hypothetical protein
MPGDAERRVEQERERVARAAHDLNNLFGVIMGCAALLARETLTEGARGRLEQIEKATSRAVSITTQELAAREAPKLDGVLAA